MINSDQQYEISKAQAAKLRAALDHPQVSAVHLHPRARKALREAAQSQLDELLTDLADYERLRDDVLEVRLTKVREYALSVFENQQEVERWLSAPNWPLGNARPINMLGTDLGMQQVLQELGQIEHGGPV